MKPVSNEMTVVFGACSAIAQEWIEIRAKEGDSFFFIDMQSERLELFANHIRIKYQTKVSIFATDLTNFDYHKEVIAQLFYKSSQPLNRVLFSYGYLGDQELAKTDWPLANRIIEVNFTSCIALLTSLLPHMILQKKGTIICLSSVAGDRGRASNYVYGAAKAGLSTFLSGMRASLRGTGVRVITVKPGMVDTPMTSHIKKSLLFSSPESVARAIFLGEKKGLSIVYAPYWWRYIMFVIVHIPETLFMKLKL